MSNSSSVDNRATDSNEILVRIESVIAEFRRKLENGESAALTVQYTNRWSDCNFEDEM